MNASAERWASPERLGPRPHRLRVAYLGPPGWLDTCCPPELTSTQVSRSLPILEQTDVGSTVDEVRRLRPHVTVVFDPLCMPPDALRRLPGITLGIVVGGVDGDVAASLSGAADALDRVLSFRPQLTGRQLGGRRLWRAIPPPINNSLFSDVPRASRRPRTMSIGRSTEYREFVLLPAKHHHDLLHVIHGVGGRPMADLLRAYDVGVYVPAERGGGFGAQVGMHLAAGQLLFANRLAPTHGLEPGIDYVPFGSPDELVWALDRLERFPEMHQRQRVRGRIKAEQYRASRVFERILHDLLLDVAAFGDTRLPA